jgi:hypothetical protein
VLLLLMVVVWAMSSQHVLDNTQHVTAQRDYSAWTRGSTLLLLLLLRVSLSYVHWG